MDLRLYNFEASRVVTLQDMGGLSGYQPQALEHPNGRLHMHLCLRHSTSSGNEMIR